MQKKTNIYVWLGLMGCTMVWAGCPDVKLGGGDTGDAGMEEIEDSDIIEVSTTELDDVIRLEDRYGREGTSQA